MANNTYVAIDSKVLLANTTTVTFTGIPQTYTDLRLIIVPASSSGTNGIRMRVGNGSVSTSSIYSGTYLDGNGTNNASFRDTNNTQFQLSYRLGINTTLTQSYVLDFLNYSSTSMNKTVLVRYNDAASATGGSTLTWRSTAAIDTMSFNINTFGSSTGDFITGSTFTLYGIQASGVSPAPKATGGAIYSDSTYYYHVFGSTGVFAPNQSISADILVVAGGGGGQELGGGGGAGGLLAFSSQSLSATNYTCTVGAGGAGGWNGTGTVGGSGGNSQFGALTACVGGGGGGRYDISGGSGGSGGGGGRGNTSGGSATSGQGFAGGNGLNGFNFSAGGGGGAGAVGANATNPNGGAGGVGATSTLINAIGAATGTGQTVSAITYFAGGGGGGNQNIANIPAGGYGGGGAGGQGGSVTYVAAGNGLPNTGGGAGGGNGGNAAGGNGGSGIVIVRYAK